jgi:hypothetical protein
MVDLFSWEKLDEVDRLKTAFKIGVEEIFA